MTSYRRGLLTQRRWLLTSALIVLFLLGMADFREASGQDAGNSGATGSNAGSGNGSTAAKGSAAQSGESGNKAKGAQSTKDGSGPSAQSNPSIPFESQMLAYGALEQISDEVAAEVCPKFTSTKATLVLYDSKTFAALQSYESFESTLLFFKAAYGAFRPKPSQEAVNPLDVASLIAQFANASTVDNASAITISDASTAMSIANSVLKRCRDHVDIVYPTVSIPVSVNQADTNDPMNDVQFVLNRKFAIPALLAGKGKDDPSVSDYKEVNDLFDSFIKGLLASDPSTGAIGMASVIQGYKLSLLLKQANAYILYVTTVAAGGTQRIRKNLITNLVTGDFISYSGGAAVNFALIDGKSLALLDARALRFMTPTTTVLRPRNSKEARKGENF